MAGRAAGAVQPARSSHAALVAWLGAMRWQTITRFPPLRTMIAACPDLPDIIAVFAAPIAA